MYLRFVVTTVDPDSRQPQGLFWAAARLMDDGLLDAEECRQLKEVIAWFNKNLPVPDKPYIKGRVTFWFRSSAQDCIRRMWALVGLLRTHGLLVEVHRCEYLYHPVYWDEFQVAAVPSRKDALVTVK